MEFVSLKSIIYEILNDLRNYQISNDEPISERIIEFKVHKARSILLKRDIDKGKRINPDYIQEYENVDGTALSIVPEVQETRTIYRTSLQIPKTIDLNHKSGLLFIGDVEGNQIQLVSESRVNFQEFKKFTSHSPLAYLKNRYIYLHNHHGLQYIRVRGIFENPTEIPNFTYDTKYPIPINMLEPLKKMILEELGATIGIPNDDKNDTRHKIESDIIQ